MEKKAVKVAIVGAGIAGLTAAYRLKERGYEVVVFEQRMHVGGKLGAHTRRIAVDPPADAKPAVRLPVQNAGAAGSAAGVAQPDYQDTIKKWCDELDNGTVPPVIVAIIQKYLEQERSRFIPRKKKPEDDGAKGLLPSYPKFLQYGLVAKKIEEQSDGVQKSTYLGIIKGWRAEEGASGADDGRAKDPENRERFRFNIWLHQNDYGKLRIEVTDDFHHEHCYHMYLNWYLNFWQLMRDIGQDRSHAFTSFHDMAHLFPGSSPIGYRLRTLTSIGSIDSIGKNLLSGVASVPEMLLWFYSLTDLVSEPLQTDRYLDMASVQGFLRSRWHATENSVLLHEYVLSKAFAIPTYLTSAYAYRTYVECGIWKPDPMVWVLNANSYVGLFEPLVREFLKKGSDGTACQLKLGRKITGFVTDEDGLVRALRYRPADMYDKGTAGNPFEDEYLRVRRQSTDPDLPENDDGEFMRPPEGPDQTHGFEADYIILAVPPKALSDIASRERERLPSLNAVRKLQSGVTAALDLHFNRKIPGIPKRHTILRGSIYGLTIFDNSQAWKGDKTLRSRKKEDGSEEICTCLSVAATDFYKIAGMGKREAIQVIIEDLKRFIQFDNGDIDLSKSYLQMNDGEPMFLNEVGSEPWRPGPRTEIGNLFVAGDFCNNEIGIVSVEGAVVSGLLAARAVQAQLREDRPELPVDDLLLSPIPVLRPKRHPRMNAAAMKVALTPLAAAAKAWARSEEFAGHPERALNPRELQASAEDMLGLPGRVAADLLQLAGEAAAWSSDLPYKGERQ